MCNCIHKLFNVFEGSTQCKHTIVHTYNAFFIDLTVSSFVSHSSLLTGKSVDLVVARDGFPSQQKSSVYFIVATSIAEVFIKQFLIRIAV